MNIDFPLENAVTKRYSVRNYDAKEIDQSTMTALKSFIDSLDNPFGKKVNFHYLDEAQMTNKKTLGTYGVIKGAKQYIGTTITLEPMSLEAVGYELEAVILYLAHLGIGTCWLGGTFNREGFATAMNVGENELFPLITPYGYPAQTKHIKERAMRKMIGADHRTEWEKLFYQNDFQTPLTREAAGNLQFPLEMIRLGPSASNKQPWRVVLKDNVCHFFEYKEPGYSDRFPYDIQRVDMGIAAAHFDFAVAEKGIKGSFEINSDPELTLPDHMEYVFSWIPA